MTEAQVQYRYRLTFAKIDSLRYIGHLDLAKTWERVFRRAQLPIVYSKGFNPQPKMQLASALPLGISSECELLDVWCEEPVVLSTLAERLDAVSPPGLRTRQVVEVDAKSPALQTLLHSAEYLIEVDDPEDGDLAERIARVISQTEIVRERRGKHYDLRPLILGLEARADHIFWTELSLGKRGTGRPDELLAALGFDPNQARMQRVALNLLPATE
jgi:radical SAM-linked protein